jgi:hypothetical protein
MVLVVLGLAMLAVGVWVEDRAAVAAPLVALGAVIVVGAVIFERWADTIQEMSLGQSGLTLKRQIPSAEELAQAGLPESAAQEIQEWMEALVAVLPTIIDERVLTQLKHARNQANLRAARRVVAADQARQQREQEPGPD